MQETHPAMANWAPGQQTDCSVGRATLYGWYRLEHEDPKTILTATISMGFREDYHIAAQKITAYINSWQKPEAKWTRIPGERTSHSTTNCKWSTNWNHRNFGRVDTRNCIPESWAWHGKPFATFQHTSWKHCTENVTQTAAGSNWYTQECWGT